MAKKGEGADNIVLDDKEFMLEKFRMLQKRIEQQHINNRRWIVKQQGKRVMYGTPVQLRHVDSGMYIQHAKRSSELDRNC